MPQLELHSCRCEPSDNPLCGLHNCSFRSHNQFNESGDDRHDADADADADAIIGHVVASCAFKPVVTLADTFTSPVKLKFRPELDCGKVSAVSASTIRNNFGVFVPADNDTTRAGG
jgi:hypothetical protein